MVGNVEARRQEGRRNAQQVCTHRFQNSQDGDKHDNVHAQKLRVRDDV